MTMDFPHIDHQDIQAGLARGRVARSRAFVNVIRRLADLPRWFVSRLEMRSRQIVCGGCASPSAG